ncbi:hypothetical protein [Amycolatopsis rifamycinica]|uniref:Uncharacterized protein n=1 Tax=Amycolatopsis rifamycinica TaxID=287986 RepID=A0A066U7Q7_9PSEU|nr:hypothetical protein [Amycolatopsis rifamycinica]KDN21902.1 hypothetical protein DV20_13375 [Amycolatopsis rifamycinica]
MVTSKAERPVLSARAALRNAAFARRTEARYIAVPRTAWLGHPAAEAEPEDEVGMEQDVREPDLPPLSRAAVTRFGAVTATLLYGVPTSVLIGTPAGLAVGAAAGIFGWLAGRSLADEYYTRHHGEDA